MKAGADPGRHSQTAPTGLQEITRIILPGVAATGRLAQVIARIAGAGDVIGLIGDLGCGKTTFARAFLHARHGQGEGQGEAAPFDVPSPSFTLVETYDLPGAPVWHFDLYRIENPDEAIEIGFEEALGHAIALIEWPERLGDMLPADRLEIELEFAGHEDSGHEDSGHEDSRSAIISGSASWALRLKGVLADVR